MPTFSELQQANDARSLVRKCLRAVAVLAPPTVDLPEKITDTTGLPIDLKALGFLPIGLVTPDGYTFGNEVTKDEIDALGYASAVRADITKAAKSVQFTALETGRRHMLELEHGMDLSAITQDATSGEVVFDDPELPIGAEYRLIVLADDGPAATNWLLGRGYPRVKLAEVGEKKWATEGGIETPITLDVFTDETLGTPMRNYIAGTGAKAASELLGFTQSGV